MTAPRDRSQLHELLTLMQSVGEIDDARVASMVEVYLLALEDALNQAFSGDPSLGKEPLDVVLDRLSERYDFDGDVLESCRLLAQLSTHLYDGDVDMNDAFQTVVSALEKICAIDSDSQEIDDGE